MIPFLKFLIMYNILGKIMKHSYQIVSIKHPEQLQQQTKRKVINPNTVRQSFNNLSSPRSQTHQQKHFTKRVMYECAFHKEQVITNFCKNKECLLPLCPKCVSIHCQDHCKRQTFADFASIDELVTEISSRLTNILPKIQSLQSMNIKRKSLLERQTISFQEYLAYWKKTIIQFVVKSFNNFEQSITQIWNEQTQNQMNLITQYEQLTKYIMEYSNSCLNKLDNPSLLLQSVIQYYLHLDQIINKTSLFENFKEMKQQKLFSLDLKENYLEELQEKLILTFLPKEEQQAFYMLAKESNKENLSICKQKINKQKEKEKEKEKMRKTKSSNILIKKQSVNLQTFRSPLQQFMYPYPKNNCYK